LGHLRHHSEVRTLNRLRVAIALIVLIALPASVAAAPAQVPFDAAADLRFDTPAPKKTPEPRKTAGPKKTPKPRKTAPPTDAPEQVFGPVPVPFSPDRTSLSVGYSEPGALGQAPFLVAQLAGYFEDAGFSDVTIVEVSSPGRDVSNGDLDFAVVPSREAWESFRSDPVVQKFTCTTVEQNPIRTHITLYWTSMSEQGTSNSAPMR
jgi:hypothetical protein